MSRIATVLVPTHSHGPLLAQAVGSALEQSISDIEIFIVGDGVDPLTRQVALDLCARDKRVTFFDKEKGPRHGELHRHEALHQASGRIVCYLSDDDLWLHDHVASMLGLLDGADFAHALPIGIRLDGSVFPWAGHLEVANSRDRVIAYLNFIPLSTGAHTLDRYRRLPFGWRTTPEGISTDAYMWSQILQEPGCVARSGTRPTVLHFPSPWREEMTPDQRLEELARWRKRIAAPDFEARFASTVTDDTARDRADKEEAVSQLSQRVASFENELQAARGQLDDQQTQLADTKERLEQAERQLADAQNRLEDRESQLTSALGRLEDCELQLVNAKDRHEVYEVQLQSLQGQLEWMSQSLTWRTRERLLRLPGVARITRWAGAARSRRAAD